MAAVRNRTTIGVIDIFAGPGGLGEGFSSFERAAGSGVHPFELAVSAEMETSAHSTLTLRSFYRLLAREEGPAPPSYLHYLQLVANGQAAAPADHFCNTKHRALWLHAQQESLNLTLGIPDHNEMLHQRIESVKDGFDDLVLIGGPPCQAYSLVGRSKMGNRVGFKTDGDKRHFLYRQYLAILQKFRPAAFIMENVKGLLTSKVGDQQMFTSILRDLANPSEALGGGSSGPESTYRLLHLSDDGRLQDLQGVEELDPARFVIRSEEYGIPQARHRVIILGVRADIWSKRRAKFAGLERTAAYVSTRQALAGLPPLRSGLSRRKDDADEWFDAMESERRKVIRATRARMPEVAHELEHAQPAAYLKRCSTRYVRGASAISTVLRPDTSHPVLNHETRGHMAGDLGRYMFCAAYAAFHEKSPVSSEFPSQLRPAHKNWTTGAFADRFRVQRQESYSSTITSHLSKDGHAFIHWDPAQCRSLTVREAARLQTFPDDYLFLGNRTQQYVQVGNAVPPLLARQIAGVVWQILVG